MAVAARAADSVGSASAWDMELLLDDATPAQWTEIMNLKQQSIRLRKDIKIHRELALAVATALRNTVADNRRLLRSLRGLLGTLGEEGERVHAMEEEWTKRTDHLAGVLQKMLAGMQDANEVAEGGLNGSGGPAGPLFGGGLQPEQLPRVPRDCGHELGWAVATREVVAASVGRAVSACDEASASTPAQSSGSGPSTAPLGAQLATAATSAVQPRAAQVEPGVGGALAPAASDGAVHSPLGPRAAAGKLSLAPSAAQGGVPNVSELFAQTCPRTELRSQVSSSGLSDSPAPTESGLERLRPLPPFTTTLIVRNLPTRYTQERLLELWPSDGTYDLLYAPCDVNTLKMKGYAFVNFCTHQHAVEFQRRWHKARLPQASRRVKPIDIAAAATQGCAANLEILRSWKADKLNNPQILPALFRGGDRLDTKQVLLGLGIAHAPASDAQEDSAVAGAGR